MNKITKQELSRMYKDEGLSTHAIARKYGDTSWGVWKLMKNYGIKRRVWGYDKYPELSRELLESLVLKGFNDMDIAKKTGYPYHVVKRRRYVRFGIKTPHVYSEHLLKYARKKKTTKHRDNLANALSKAHKSDAFKNNVYMKGYFYKDYGKGFTGGLRRKVREKFDYKCILCEKSEETLGEPLHAHHVDYNKTNNTLNNLVPLCRSCHAMTNWRKEEWKNYFTSKDFDLFIAPLSRGVIQVGYRILE